MTQTSTTAVSRFQFRNRLSFQEYSSFTRKSDFLSKMFFFDFCQTEILGSLQKMTLVPRLHSDEHPLDASRHGARAQGFTPGILCPRGEMVGLPRAACGSIRSYPSPISQRQSRSSQAACGGN